jgi:hypothetical protein
MKHRDILEIVPQIFTFIGSENTERQANQCPEMHDMIVTFVVLAEFMYLGMAVMTGRYTVCRAGGFDLIVFQFAVSQALFLVSRLEKTTTAATAVIIGLVGRHIDEVFFSHDRFDDKAQIVGNGITVAFTDDLTGILSRKFDFKVFVPVGADLKFAFPDPFRIVFVNVFYDEAVLDVEFFQSCQD